LWVRTKHGWRAWFDLDFIDGHRVPLSFFDEDASAKNEGPLTKIGPDSITSNKICKSFCSLVCKKTKER
jgi:hypothetical protein